MHGITSASCVGTGQRSTIPPGAAPRGAEEPEQREQAAGPRAGTGGGHPGAGSSRTEQEAARRGRPT